MGKNLPTLSRTNKQSAGRECNTEPVSPSLAQKRKNHDKSTLPTGVHVYSDKFHLQIDKSCAKTARSQKQATLNPS